MFNWEEKHTLTVAAMQFSQVENFRRSWCCITTGRRYVGSPPHICTISSNILVMLITCPVSEITDARYLLLFVKSLQDANLLIKVHRLAFARFVSTASNAITVDWNCFCSAFLCWIPLREVHDFVCKTCLSFCMLISPISAWRCWCATVSMLFYIQYHRVLFLISYST